MYFRMFIFVISLAVLLPFQVYAGTATQIDWSGSEGIFGPVTNWGNDYYADTDVECYCDSSDIALLKTMLPVPLVHIVDENYTGGHSIYSADINGDGCMDIIGAAYWDSTITWWENMDDYGTVWVEHVVDGAFYSPTSVYPEDINGDGFMDIIGASRGDNCVTWWENADTSGTSWTEHIVDGAFDAPSCVYAKDINGDGYMDVLGAAQNDDEITWWENADGSGTSWTEHIVDSSGNYPISVYAADVNGDGCMDILGADQNWNCISWWENMDSTGTSWTKHTVDTGFNGAASVYSTDVNGDGYMDVLGAAYYAGDIVWWKNVDGSGLTWTEHALETEFAGAYSVFASDFNNDGYMDVLGAAQSDGDVTWWENMDSTGTSWTEHLVDGDFTIAISVSSADVNGDGYMDILGGSMSTRPFVWWDLTEYIPDGSLESSVLDIQESPDWQTIDWTSTEPAGTSISLQVRASDNSSSMGAWSDTLASPCSLDGILADQDKYFQYRVILNTSDSLLSPVLHDVTVDWLLFTGIEEGYAGEVYEFMLFGAHPNPAIGQAALVFTLPVDSRAELTVYDLAGRTVQFSEGDYGAGTHELIVKDLASGVYLVHMVSGEFTATRQFVVLE